MRWVDFPLSLSVTHYLVRFKEPHGVSTLFRASSYSDTYYTNRLKAYTSYDVQVFAFTTSADGNVTYSSQTVTIKTPEGGKLYPSLLPPNGPTCTLRFCSRERSDSYCLLRDLNFILKLAAIFVFLTICASNLHKHLSKLN